MLIFLGIIILVISFVVALVSMFREQRKLSHNARTGVEPASRKEMQEAQVESRPVGVENLDSSKPDAKKIDLLKSRIEELEAQEAAPSQRPERVKQLDESVSQQSNQRVIAPSAPDQNEDLADLFGAEHRHPPISATTINIADLVRKRNEK